MKNLLALLEGKKTYVCSAILFILGGCKAMGWVDDDAYMALLGIFGAGGLAGLRAAKN